MEPPRKNASRPFERIRVGTFDRQANILFSHLCNKTTGNFFFYWKFKTEGKLLMLVSQTIINGFTSAPYILEKQFEKTKLAPSTSIFLTTNVMNLLQNDLVTFLNFQNVKKIEIKEFIFRGINSLLNSFFFLFETTLFKILSCLLSRIHLLLSVHY